jgi:hypothetical protein
VCVCACVRVRVCECVCVWKCVSFSLSFFQLDEGRWCFLCSFLFPHLRERERALWVGKGWARFNYYILGVENRKPKTENWKPKNAFFCSRFPLSPNSYIYGWTLLPLLSHCCSHGSSLIFFSVPTCVNEFDRHHDFKAAAAATHRRLIKVKGLMTWSPLQRCFCSGFPLTNPIQVICNLPATLH